MLILTNQHANSPSLQNIDNSQRACMIAIITFLTYQYIIISFFSIIMCIISSKKAAMQ